MDTALIGDDTGLLILLCCHASLVGYFFFRSKEKYKEDQRVEHQGYQGTIGS